MSSTTCFHQQIFAMRKSNPATLTAGTVKSNLKGAVESL